MKVGDIAITEESGLTVIYASCPKGHYAGTVVSRWVRGKWASRYKPLEQPAKRWIEHWCGNCARWAKRYPLPVWRPEVLAAFRLGGLEAAHEVAKTVKRRSWE